MYSFQGYHQGFDQTRLLRLSALAPKAVERLTQTALFSAVQALSGQPIDPYERFKLQYFDADYKFPAINDIEIPNDFDPITYGEHIINYQKNLTDVMMQHLSCYETAVTLATSIEHVVERIENIPGFTLSETDIKNNIRYNEFMKTVTLQDIYNNPEETNNKIITFFVNNLQQKY